MACVRSAFRKVRPRQDRILSTSARELAHRSAGRSDSLAPTSMHCVKSAPVRSQPVKSAPFNRQVARPKPGSTRPAKLAPTRVDRENVAPPQALPPADRHSATPPRFHAVPEMSMPAVVQSRSKSVRTRRRRSARRVRSHSHDGRGGRPACANRCHRQIALHELRPTGIVRHPASAPDRSHSTSERPARSAPSRFAFDKLQCSRSLVPAWRRADSRR